MIIVVSVAATVIDVVLKMAAFWYFPSQGQIYCEASKVEMNQGCCAGSCSGRGQEYYRGESTEFWCGFERWRLCCKKNDADQPVGNGGGYGGDGSDDDYSDDDKLVLNKSGLSEDPDLEAGRSLRNDL